MEKIKKIKEISENQYKRLIKKMKDENIKKILTGIYVNLDNMYDKAIENLYDKEMYRNNKYISKELNEKYEDKL